MISLVDQIDHHCIRKRFYIFFWKFRDLMCFVCPVTQICITIHQMQINGLLILNDPLMSSIFFCVEDCEVNLVKVQNGQQAWQSGSCI